VVVESILVDKEFDCDDDNVEREYDDDDDNDVDDDNDNDNDDDDDDGDNDVIILVLLSTIFVLLVDLNNDCVVDTESLKHLNGFVHNIHGEGQLEKQFRSGVSYK